MQRHPEVGVVCSDWDLIDRDGRFLGARESHAPPVTRGLDYIGQTMRSGRTAVGLPGAMIRRAALGDIRMDKDAKIGFGDFPVWFRIAEKSDIGHVNGRLWRWRQDQRSESARTIESMSHDYEENLSGYCDEHLARWPEHAQLVRDWRRSIHRYLFWALVFEVGLHFRKPSAPTEQADRTVFEMMNYRLTPDQFHHALEQLAAHQRGPVEWLARQLLQAMIRARFTWPLAWATEHHASLGTLLGLR
jgi:hypothetical protein